MTEPITAMQPGDYVVLTQEDYYYIVLFSIEDWASTEVGETLSSKPVCARMLSPYLKDYVVSF